MRYLSVCSGIEAATVAWHPLRWEPAAFAEIEKFPSSVLRHRYPEVPNAGDFTTIKGDEYGAVELLVGGTPCQAFSVAGLRAGLADARGNLTLEFLRLADRVRPRWLVWENVPGVFSATSDADSENEAHAFSCFLAGLQELGYGFAYRVLDAQYFGVPQRRRRVFVVGHSGDWRRAAAVLFESYSMSGNTPPSREKGQGFTHDVAPCLTSGGRGVERSGETRGQDPVVAVEWPAEVAPTLNAAFGVKLGLEDQHIRGGVVYSSTGEVAHCLNAGGMGRQDFETETMIAVGGFFDGPTHPLRAEGFDASEDGTGRGNPLVTVPTLTSNGDAHSGYRDEHGLVPIAWSEELTASIDLAGTVQRGGQGGRHDGVMTSSMAVRRLTPRECERLQGFPDDYTKISDKTPDGPRYKALGNSMAVPVMLWIGERIAAVEAINLVRV